MTRSLGVAAALLCSAASASLYETHGFGPRAVAMGGAMTAEANDYTAVFYNPARLVEATDVNFGFAFQWNPMVSTVTAKDLAKRDDLDCTYCVAPAAVGYSLGLVFPLGGKVKNRVALGLGLTLPTAKMLRLLAADPKQPYWYHYQSHPERIAIHTALGIKILEQVQLGLGIEALADLLGEGATVQVDLFNKEVKGRQVDSHLATRVAPIFSLQVKPFKQLRIAATFRWEMSLYYLIPAEVDLVGVGTLGFQMDGYTHYTPHTLQFGAAYDVTDDFTVTLDGEWQHWSAAPSPYMNLNIDLSGDTLKALGLDEALDTKSPNQKPGFVDTLQVRLGAEYRLSPRFAARLGGFYRPTPVPKQNAPGTNILDANTIGAAVGVGFNFPDPLEVFKEPVKIDVAAQGQFLLPRETSKEPTDPVPSYTYSAQVFGLTAAIRYDF